MGIIDIIIFNILITNLFEYHVKVAFDLNFVIGLERIESLSGGTSSHI